MGDIRTDDQIEQTRLVVEAEENEPSLDCCRTGESPSIELVAEAGTDIEQEAQVLRDAGESEFSASQTRLSSPKTGSFSMHRELHADDSLAKSPEKSQPVSIRRVAFWSALFILIITYAVALRDISERDWLMLQSSLWSVGSIACLMIGRRWSGSRASHEPTSESLEVIMSSGSKPILSSFIFLCLLILAWLACKLLLPESLTYETISGIRFASMGIFCIFGIRLAWMHIRRTRG